MSDQTMEFRRNFDRWSAYHPRSWSVQTDTTGLVDFLQTEFARVRSAQLEASARLGEGIIVSQERIIEGLDRASVGIERITDGLEGLQAAFEWGFSELIWQIEETREVLKNILGVLQRPLDAQAKELKERAIIAYRNGLFDDALVDFTESEKKNRYDFTIHQNMGNIYLFEKKDPLKALECYEKAAKYAKLKSTYHSSLAFLHVGLIRYLQGDFNAAREATAQAINLTPRFLEAHYQHAQYCTKLRKYDEAIDHIREAVEGDRYYVVKICSEEDFKPITRQTTSLFTEMRNEMKTSAEQKISRIQGPIEEAESLDRDLYLFGLKSTKARLNRVKTLLKHGSFFDCDDAVTEADRCLSSFREELSSFYRDLQQQIRKKSSEIEQKIREKGEHKIREKEDRRENASTSSAKGTASVIIFAISLFSGLMGGFILAVSYFASSDPSVRDILQYRPHLMLYTVACLAIATSSRLAVRVYKSKLTTTIERERKLLEDTRKSLEDTYLAPLKERCDKIHERYGEYLTH